MKMMLTKNLGMLLLGIYLILTGLLQILTVGVLASLGPILPILALLAGIFILMGR